MNFQDLYAQFDAVFPRPAAFHNFGCCVSPEDERPLLTLPRERLTVDMLAHTMQHYLSCFGTFREVAYFVPRLLELLTGGEDLGEVLGFWRSLLHDRERYEALNLWEPIVSVVRGHLDRITAEFVITHFDAEECRARGWGLYHCDLVKHADLRDQILAEFLAPALAEDPGAWEALFAVWAEDPNPHRVAHLLDLLRDIWGGYSRLATDPGIAIPPGLSRRLESDDWILGLLERAHPVITSATWADDFLAAAAAGRRPNGSAWQRLVV